MKFILYRDDFIQKLQNVISIIINRPVLPILANLLLVINNEDNNLIVTSTNLEVEIVTNINILKIYQSGSTTVSAKKIFNICRCLPENAEIMFTLKNHKIKIKCNNSQYTLLTTESEHFPNIKNWEKKIQIFLNQESMQYLIKSTFFAIAHQDVRYYLNGMLIEIYKNNLCAVASDGHKLAFCSINVKNNILSNHSIIIPKKSVIELLRLLKNKNNLLKIDIGNSNIRFYIDDIIFTSKLIDGKFPNYKNLICDEYDHFFIVNNNLLKQALLRISILSNEQFNGARFFINKKKLILTLNNNDQETATEIIEILFNKEKKIEICFNINYLLDSIKCFNHKYIKCFIKNDISSMKIENSDNNQIQCIIMAMRI